PYTTPRPPFSTLFPYTTLFRSYSLNSFTMRLPAPGMVRISSSVAVFKFTGMNTYCLSRLVSCGPTYLPISLSNCAHLVQGRYSRSEEHTSELQSQSNLVCRLLL